MAGLRSAFFFLLSVMSINAEGHNKHADGCFERFGSDRSLCNATDGLCVWMEKDGEGKCLMPKRAEGHGKHPDGCFERFGSDRALCNATEGLCLWVEKDGEGKCLMPKRSEGHGKHADGCFERFGSDMTSCNGTNGLCLWVEQDGEGKCLMPNHAQHRGNGAQGRGGKGGNNPSADGGDRRQEGREGKGGNKAPAGAREERSHQVEKITGILSISVSSSLTSPEVLEQLNQQRLLLEKALARSHVYHKVSILGLDTARRLRAAVSTQVHVRFEAEATQSREPSPEEPQLETVLQQSFAKAGLDFQVQSATVAITSTEAVSRPSSMNTPLGAAIAGGLVFILCTCSALVLMCMRRHSATKARKQLVCGSLSPPCAHCAVQGASNLCVAPVLGVPSEDNDKCKPDIDLDSISTGTPGTNDDIPEDCP